MAIARKSDASATSNLSQKAKSSRNQSSSNHKKLSTHREVALKAKQLRTNQTPLPPFAPPESSRQKRLSATNLLNSRQEIAPQTSSTEKTSRMMRQRIPVMPSAESVPLWLLRLSTMHRHSSIMAFLLVGVTLVVYGWTVYSQELWSQSYRKLQNLQRQERQLMTNNEMLKNNLAKEAEKQPEKLVAPTPSEMIFLPRSPMTQNSQPNTTIPIPQIQQQTLNPLGY